MMNEPAPAATATERHTQSPRSDGTLLSIADYLRGLLARPFGRPSPDHRSTGATEPALAAVGR